MSPLRQRLIDELTLRGYAARTIDSYVAVVARLARHYRLAPDQLTEEQLRSYLLQLTTTLAPASVTQALSGLRFFYEHVVMRPWTVLDLARPKRDKKLPVVLSRAEVECVLAAVQVPAYRVCLTVIYGCGLRLLEATQLRVTDIDGARGLVHVRHGKGGMDRMVPVPDRRAPAVALALAHASRSAVALPGAASTRAACRLRRGADASNDAPTRLHARGRREWRRETRPHPYPSA
jgi:integrase/recombinase XerD